MVRRLRREFLHVFLSVGAPPAPISILGLPPGLAWARTHVGPGPLSWGPTWARPWAHPGLGLESAFKVGIIPTRIEQVTKTKPVPKTKRASELNDIGALPKSMNKFTERKTHYF